MLQKKKEQDRMAKARFQYLGAERKVEDVSRAAKQGMSVFDSYIDRSLTTYKPKEGECNVRIMPPSWGKEEVKRWGGSWSIEVYVHFGVGPDNAAYLCLDKMKNTRCPVCEAQRMAEDDEEAKALRPSARALCWVIDRGNERAGPQVWSMPNTMYKELMSRSVDKKAGCVIKFDDPGGENSKYPGYDIVFNREGTNLKTKYSGVEVLREGTPLNDDPEIQGKWLDFITEYPLPEVLAYFDAEYIEKVLCGRSARDEAADTDWQPRARTAEHRHPEDDEKSQEDAPIRRTRRSEDDVQPQEDATPVRRTRRVEVDESATDEGEARRSRRTTSRDVGTSLQRDQKKEDEPPFDTAKDANGEDDTPKDPPQSRVARRSLERLRTERTTATR